MIYDRVDKLEEWGERCPELLEARSPGHCPPCLKGPFLTRRPLGLGLYFEYYRVCFGRDYWIKSASSYSKFQGSVLCFSDVVMCHDVLSRLSRVRESLMSTSLGLLPT